MADFQKEFLNGSVDNLRELQVLEHKKYNEAKISKGFRPDYDVLIKKGKVTTKYEVKTQKVYDVNDDKFVIEIAELSVNKGNRRYIAPNDRYKKWYKTALLLSHADKYVLLKYNGQLKEIKIGSIYSYYEIDKWKLLNPIENFLQSVNSDISETNIEFNDNDFTDQLNILADEATRRYSDRYDFGSSSKIPINNGALESYNITRSDFGKGSGKFNIVFNFNMKNIDWSKFYNGQDYDFSVAPYQSENYKGIETNGDLKDYVFISPNPKGSGKKLCMSYSSSSDSSSSESDHDKSMKTFFKKLTKKIKSNKK